MKVTSARFIRACARDSTFSTQSQERVVIYNCLLDREAKNCTDIKPALTGKALDNQVSGTWLGWIYMVWKTVGEFPNR